MYVQYSAHYDANSGEQKWRENAVMFSLFATEDCNNVNSTSIK